jgi:hypothetical protein
VAGESAQRGSIERGKIADRGLVDGEPTVDTMALRRASLVIQVSVTYAPAALYAAMGFKRSVAVATIEAVPLALP